MRLAVFLATALAFAASRTAFAAAADWHRATTRHLIVYSDGPVDNLREFTDQLSRFDEVLRARTRIPSEDGLQPLTVFLVKDQDAVAKAQGFSGNGGVYGFYSGPASGAVMVAPRRGYETGTKLFDYTPDTIVLHEYTHHFMLLHFPQVYSAWFSEGMAELYSTIEFGPGDEVTIGRPALARLPALRSGKLAPLDWLLSRGADANSLYSKGWLLTHYLNFTPRYAVHISDYLAARNAGKGEKEAVEGAFGVSVSRLDSEMTAYLMSGHLPIITVSVPRSAGGEVRIEEVPPVQAMLMPDFIMQRAGPPDFQKKPLAARIRRVAADHPDDLFAQRLAAEAELSIKRYDDAERDADAALRLSAADPRAMLVEGRARLMALADAGSKDKAAWAAARGWVVKANRADPDDALPLIAYYQSFVFEGVTPPPIASDGLARALELAPQDDETRMLLATDEARQGRYGDAIKSIRPIAARPHSSAATKGAAELLAEWGRQVSAVTPAPPRP